MEGKRGREWRGMALSEGRLETRPRKREAVRSVRAPAVTFAGKWSVNQENKAGDMTLGSASVRHEDVSAISQRMSSSLRNFRGCQRFALQLPLMTCTPLSHAPLLV